MYNREEAAKRAENARTNTPDTCQMWTRNIFGAPSVGDVDKDGDADAVDGWKSEPASQKHTTRNPPRGVPVSFSGGSHGYGHRAVSLGNGKIRGTDSPTRGKVGTVTIEWFEKNWGLTYLGWSNTISGNKIPMPPKATAPTPAKKAPAKKAAPKKPSRGVHVDTAIESLKKAKGKGERGTNLKIALDALNNVPPVKK